MSGKRLDPGTSTGPTLDVDTGEIDLRGRPAPSAEPRTRGDAAFGDGAGDRSVGTRATGPGDQSFAHRKRRRVGRSPRPEGPPQLVTTAGARRTTAEGAPPPPTGRTRVGRRRRIVTVVVIGALVSGGIAAAAAGTLAGEGSSTAATAPGATEPAPADATPDDPTSPPGATPDGSPTSAPSERARAGAALAANPALTLEGDTRRQLVEGEVDERVMAVLATLVVDRQMVVTAFPTLDETDSGVRRGVEVSTVDGVGVRPGVPETAGLLDAVRAQEGRFAPERVAFVGDGVTTPTLLQIVYPAPVPTEDLR